MFGDLDLVTPGHIVEQRKDLCLCLSGGNLPGHMTLLLSISTTRQYQGIVARPTNALDFIDFEGLVRRFDKVSHSCA